MSDTTQNDAGSADGGAADGGTGAGTQTPAGFVPQADLEREQARARSFQSELDRTKAQLAEAQRLAESAGGGGKNEGNDGGTAGFDPDAFRSSLLRDVVQTTQLANAVSDLKGQFPHADPAIYGRLAEFGSIDALRLAVEDSHNRVASILAAQTEAIEAKLREEYGGKIGGGGPADGATNVPAGDPSVEQLSRMSIAELNELEKTNPGVVERVLRSANS